MKKEGKVEFILVKIMDLKVEIDSDEEKEKSEKLKKTIKEEIINQNKNPSYDTMQELVVQYGYNIEKQIEEEVKKNPENFMNVKSAINQKNSNEQLFVLGKLGESLENMGIKVVIDKRQNLNNEDYIINNQFISSGIIDRNKFEIHIDEKDNKKKYNILNEENEQKKFIEEWKETISNYTSIPKNEIFITNIRKGSLIMDTIFKKMDLKDIKGNKIDIFKKMENFANSHPKILSIFVKNILGACKLTLDMLDSRGDRRPNDWAKPGEMRGGLEYFPPDKNWIGFGLRVWDLYGSNDWIGMDGNKNEWAVAYHGTSESAVNPICSQNGKFFSTIKEGATRQKCKDDINVNESSKGRYQKCGEGTYSSPHLEYAEGYGGVIIMCRVNPRLMRIPSKFGKIEWITDGTRNTIRPYRIIYRINK